MDDDTFALIDCDGKVDGIRCGPRERVTTDRTRTAVRDLYFNRQSTTPSTVVCLVMGWHIQPSTYSEPTLFYDRTVISALGRGSGIVLQPYAENSLLVACAS